MPKETKKSFSRSHPFSNKPERKNLEKPSEIDEKEWKEATCPACLEPPHNPVLLVCSSHEKGCRPYMCDTSPLLSNCLNQYRKSSPTEGLTCPLCRGVVREILQASTGLFEYMNSKPRDCSREDCEFRGSYLELMEHARKDHADTSGDDMASSDEMRPVSNIGRRTMRIRDGYYPILRRNQPRRFVYSPGLVVNF